MISQTHSQIVDYKELGVSFKIPDGWTSQINGEFMFLRHNSISGLMVVFESRSKSVNELLFLANNGINEDGLQLRSLNDFKETTNNKVEGHYEGSFMGSVVKGYAIGIIDGLGSGVSVLALSEPNNFNDTLKNEAQKLMTSVAFNSVIDSDKTSFWKKRLVGNRLKYRNTLTNFYLNGTISTGISDKETLDLFNDGSFYYHVNNQSLIGSSTIRDGDKSSGNYRIVTLGSTTYLQLFFNGDSMEFELTINKQNNTLLNGRRFLIDSIND